MKITEDELLEALRSALYCTENDEGTSVHELSASLKCGDGKVRGLLRILASEGRLEVLRARRLSIDGRWNFIPTYRIKDRV